MPAQIMVVSLGGRASDQIADILRGAGHAVDVAGGITAAGRAIAGHELVIIDAAATGAAADACQHLRPRLSNGVPIVAVSPSDDVDDRIALLEAGADDVLGRSFKGAELLAFVDALLARRRPVRSGATGATVPASTSAPDRPGRVIVFLGTRGGAGTTTLAVNAALVLAEGGASVVIADLDFHHGQVATHLNVAGRQTTAQLARDEQLAVNPLLVRGGAVQHDSGVNVLAAPSRPDEGGLVSGDDVIELVNALRRAYGTAVIDAGSAAGSRAMALVAVADVSVVVLTPEIPGLRAAQGALDALSDAGVLGDQTLFVLNHPFAHGAIERAAVERTLGISVAAEIGHDGANAIRAANEGQPLVVAAPRSPVSLAIRRLAPALAGQSGSGGTAPRPSVPPRRLLRRVLNRSGGG